MSKWPGVITIIWPYSVLSFSVSWLKGDVTFTFVFFAILDKTSLTWTTNSLVWAKTTTWILLLLSSTEDMAPKPKAPVFPLPFLAWAITLSLGSFIIIGKVVAWILEGCKKLISRRPFLISSLTPNVSHVFASENTTSSPTIFFIPISLSISFFIGTSNSSPIGLSSLFSFFSSWFLVSSSFFGSSGLVSSFFASSFLGSSFGLSSINFKCKYK